MYFTVFTPTYNRAYILAQAYNSLCCQTYKDFKWVIMDDGSEDGTDKIVSSWIDEKKVKIEYYRQSNQGRFAAYNNSIPYFEGKILVPLDSDDFLKADALEIIHENWEERDKRLKLIGVISSMQHGDGKILGMELPHINCVTTLELNDKYRISGDKHKCYVIESIKKYKYPIFENEKFIGDSLLHYWLDREGALLVLKDKFYVRDYPPDSLTRNIAKVHYNSPRGMALYYKSIFPLFRKNKKKKIAYAIKYVAFSRLCGNKIFEKDIKQKAVVALALLPGIIYAQKVRRSG